MTEPDRDGRQVRDWVCLAARAAADKGGADTTVLEVGRVLAIVDAFVITCGRNRRQVATIADEVRQRLRSEAGRSPLRTEGLEDSEWVLIDYGDFVVHVFLDETRRYYTLERLWADAPRLEWEPARS
jgi:ribosome-associated protein